MPAPEIRVASHAPATLTLAGALVFDTAVEALRRTDEHLRRSRHDTLDLEGVTRVDSAGLACVLAAMAAARRHGGTLTVVHVPPDLAALAQVCEVAPLLAPSF